MDHKKQTKIASTSYGSDCEPSCAVSCPLGWERKGDFCYFWSNNKTNWFDAEEACKRKGGHLASVKNREVHEYMVDKLPTVWIGGVIQEDRWVWTDCSDWTFDSGWKEGEPNHLDIEHCAEYREIGWNNVDCNLWINEYVCSKGICKGKSQTFNTFSMHIDFGRSNK